ncbi:MAG: hypothetical protein JO211_05115, partial [Acidobacteriaceae bacterium]|nr:hypothetical protein [Acidobacteriaceae bacterium]
MRTAVPLVLQADLLTAKNAVAVIAADDSGAYQFGATAVVRTTVQRLNGRTTIQATVTDLATQRERERIRLEGSSSGELLSVANTLAVRLNAQATQFSTKSEQALRDFATAASVQNVQGRIQGLNAAITVDPAYGQAYISLAEILAQAGQDPASVFENGARHLSAFTPADRARFLALEARAAHAPLVQQGGAEQAVLRLAP